MSPPDAEDGEAAVLGEQRQRVDHVLELGGVVQLLGGEEVLVRQPQRGGGARPNEAVDVLQALELIGGWVSVVAIYCALACSFGAAWKLEISPGATLLISAPTR